MFHPPAAFFLFFLSFRALASGDNGSVLSFNFKNGNTSAEQGRISAQAYALSPVDDRFGNPRSAFFFHGTQGSYLNLGTDARLKPAIGSISLWFKIEHPMLNGRGVEVNPLIITRSHEGDDHNEAYFIGYDFETKNINANTSYSKAQQVTVYSASEISLREWHHAVLTYDDAFLSFYIDGVLEIKMSKNFRSVFLATDSVIVGNRVGPKNARFFNGCIDDIAFYDRVLAPAEVNELFHAPNPNKAAVFLQWVIIILACVTGILVIIYIIRHRVSVAVAREKDKNELKNKLVEQEMRVLKAQMDPHFIFNALNTVQQFIIAGENEKAQGYLAKFAKLIRKLLESNTSDYTLLSEEIEILEKYLEIESVRFNNVFRYSISVDERIDPVRAKIPHFIVQPFVENAIWHGLLPKDGYKRLSITFSYVDDSTIACKVEDNGVGVKEATGNIKLEKRSLAVGFVRQRLEVMGKLKKRHYEVLISERLNSADKAEGTIVMVTMPVTLKESNDYARSNN
jgi:hypothetical protein